MHVSDEMVEVACAAEQHVTGRFRWPDEWIPELAAEYRESMRVFLATIVPFIEAEALEEAACLAERHGSVREKEACLDQASLIAASIRARIVESKKLALI